MRFHYISHLERQNLPAPGFESDTMGSLESARGETKRERHLLEQKGFEK